MRRTRWQLSVALLMATVVGIAAYAEDPFAASATGKKSAMRTIDKSPAKSTDAPVNIDLPPMDPSVLAAAQKLAATVAPSSPVAATPSVDAVAPTPAPAVVEAAAVDTPIAPTRVDTDATMSAKKTVQPTMTTLWLRAGAAFVFVVTLVLMTAALARKALAKSGAVTASGKALLQIVQILPLGAKQKIAVVRFDEQTLLLGITGQQMQLLATNPPAATAQQTSVSADSHVDYVIPAQAPTLEQRVAAGSDIAGAPTQADLLEQVRGTIRALKPLSWRGRKLRG